LPLSAPKQEQLRVAVGPGNAHVIIRQVSCDAATLCGAARAARGSSAAAAAAVRQFTD